MQVALHQVRENAFVSSTGETTYGRAVSVYDLREYMTFSSM